MYGSNMPQYLDFISPLLGSQADAIYVGLSSAFDPVPCALVLHKLSAFGLWWLCKLVSQFSDQETICGLCFWNFSFPIEIHYILSVNHT
jgi:hypothetical protein